ncbi:hypothetical protein Tco_1343856 [Tanacetum coccineum]
MTSSNTCNMQIAQPGMTMGHGRQMQMVGVNIGNQMIGYNVGRNGNKIVRNQNGNVVALVIWNNGNGVNDADKIKCYNCKEDDIAPIFDTYTLAEVPYHTKFSDNDMFNLLAHKKKHFELP